MVSESPSIAVLGASASRSKFGNKCVRAYLAAGYRVIPINPREVEIEGSRVVARLDEIEGAVDRISVYLPPETTLALLPEIATVEVGEVWFNPGTTDAKVRKAVEAEGIRAIFACSIVDLGVSPSDFP